MTKRALALLIVAVVFAAGAAVAIATSIGGDEAAQEVHTLEDGSVHTGPMPTTERQMDDGDMMDMDH